MDANHLEQCQNVVSLAREGKVGEARFQLGLLGNRSREYYRYRPEVGAWRWAAGETELAGGRAGAAQENFRAALEVLLSTQSYRESHGSLIADIYRSLGRAAMKTRKWGEAEEALQESIRFAAGVDGEDSWERVLRIRPSLACAMFLAGNGEARRTLDEGLARCRALWGIGGAETREYIERSRDMLRRIGETGEAEHYEELLSEEETSEAESILREADSLIALSEGKQYLHSIYHIHQLSEKRVAEGLPAVPLRLHTALLGPPGTGKSTLARLLGRLWSALGVIPTAGVTEAVGGDIASPRSAKSVGELCQRAEGGVLLLQEAYSIPSRYRAEALAALLEHMDSGRFGLVATGYTEPMEEFIGGNPGLESRFAKILHLAPYSPEEQLEIFTALADRYALSLGPEAREAVLSQAGEGGARRMERLFQDSLLRQASRLGDNPGAEITSLLAEDIATE